MTGNGKRPQVAEPVVVDPKVAEALRDPGVAQGHEISEISQADGQATGEGYAMSIRGPDPTDPTEAIKRMRAYTELVKVRGEEIWKRRAVAVGFTNQHHWNNIEGNPYLNKAGSRLLERIFRVAERDRVCKQTWHEDELGRFYQYEYEAIFDAGGEFECVYALGTRNQRGKFFATKKETVKDEDGNVVMMKGRNGQEYPKRESVRRDLSEIDPGDIKKSAWTNCLVNGIQALLAIDGITWEEVTELTGGKVRQDNVQQVSFGGRGADGKDGPATDPQCRLLYAKAKAAGGDECLAALCKHLNIPKLRDGKDGPVHVLFNQVNMGVKFTEQWGGADGAARGAEGMVTKQEAERLQEGKDALGISDADWKKKWSNLPHLMKRSLFQKAIDWLNDEADAKQ